MPSESMALRSESSFWPGSQSRISCTSTRKLILRELSGPSQMLIAGPSPSPPKVTAVPPTRPKRRL